MFLFLVPLLLGFLFNSASTFTGFYSRRLGARIGRLTSILLRDGFGIPVWVFGYVLAARQASSKMFNPVLISSTIAWLLILAGAVIIFTGLVSLKWRAAAPSLQDTLVAHGIYAHVRHPIYSGMVLELIGLFLWMPTYSVMLAGILGILWVMIQARLEEIDLMARIPLYKDAMRQVPRFFTKAQVLVTIDRLSCNELWEWDGDIRSYLNGR